MYFVKLNASMKNMYYNERKLKESCNSVTPWDLYSLKLYNNWK